ncbi:MAG: hypothetical protein IJ745_08520 [Bacteroidales bacterium]|nr:hypothetical protein [Bacteroidales bacterium]
MMTLLTKARMQFHEALVEGKRLKDISDLPLDLAV